MALAPNARLAQQVIIEKALAYFGQENVVALFHKLEEKGIRKDQVLDMHEKFAEALAHFLARELKFLRIRLFSRFAC